MKVALVYPEVYDLARFKEKRKEFPPFGVLYLAAFLEENHFKVDLIKVSQDNTQCDFRDYDVVGFSVPSSATYGIVKEARFKSLYSGNPTIAVGGIHPSFYPEETIVDFRADVVAIGSGERTFLEIVQAHITKDFSQISGVCCLKAQSIIITPKRIVEDSIDWLPMPARHLLNKSDFIMSNRLAKTDIRMTHIMLSRGCPFSCHFCAVMQKRIQYRSGNNIRVELEHLKHKYNIGGFAIVDDNFVVNKNMVRNVCESIGNLGLRWSALSRVDTVDYELLETMHGAGCVELKFGVESGSERMLKAMGKNISSNQIRQAITLATSVGIQVKIFLIHGFPGENLASTQETISLLKDIGPMVDRVSLFRFVPLPGSYVFRNADLFNLNIPKHISDWWKFHIYHNNHHWWGNKEDFQQMELAYQELLKFIVDRWP
ncbi:MAG: radical SAM protein [Patescibacteria group bacterium]|jgi:radical SAM superfamily enzyme YgiQ (UPF0313 family)